jgi:predicted GTPase
MPIDVVTSQAGTILLDWNPNVGKSAIFGALTKRSVTISNSPGTTIEITEGVLPDGTRIVDTPGTNSHRSGFGPGVFRYAGSSFEMYDGLIDVDTVIAA